MMSAKTPLKSRGEALRTVQAIFNISNKELAERANVHVDRVTDMRGEKRQRSDIVDSIEKALPPEALAVYVALVYGSPVSA
jgi:predicted transcriptional regulator